jgi:hypothetical protein
VPLNRWATLLYIGQNYFKQSLIEFELSFNSKMNCMQKYDRFKNFFQWINNLNLIKTYDSVSYGQN